MEHHSIIFTIFLIFAGATVFSTLAIYMRQSLLVAYMLFGVCFGSWGLQAVPDVDWIHKIDEIGIIFLMFLLGLNLQPQNLLKMVGKTVWVTLFSSSVFFAIGYLVGYWFGFNIVENLIIGSCMMFSSTIISLKLMPTHNAKHLHTTHIMVSILLLQDILAIIVLLCIGAAHKGKVDFASIILIAVSLPVILLFVFLVQKFILKKIFAKFSEVREYMFLVAVAWCLGVAELAEVFGLSYEIGAFIAGLAIAASPMVFYISSQMQPIRDFFLVLFFFLVGASFNLGHLNVIAVPVLILTLIFLVLKPVLFHFLLRQVSEVKSAAKEVGIRLGQLSEFSLLVIFLASRSELIGHSAAYLVQAVTMLLFIASSYLVVMRYPSQKISDKIMVEKDMEIEGE